MDISLARTLYLYCRNNAERVSKLEIMLDDAFQAVASGKGAQVISTTSNGLAVSFGAKSMTNAEWFETLTTALSYCVKGYPSNQPQIIIR